MLCFSSPPFGTASCTILFATTRTHLFTQLRVCLSVCLFVCFYEKRIPSHMDGILHPAPPPRRKKDVEA